MIKIFYKNYFLRKCFGQNFLCNKFIINSIVNIINPNKYHIMLEIGPGFGILTKKIAILSKSITIVEVDYNLIIILNKLKKKIPKLNIIHQDVMSLNFYNLSLKIGKPIRIYGNLPYNISVSFLFYILNYINLIKDMFLMFQKEVADRLLALPNTKFYCKLSVIFQYFFYIYKIIDISPNCFKPIPKVKSVLLKFYPNFSFFPKKEILNLNILSKYAFNKKYKGIYNNIKYFLNFEEFSKLGINPNISSNKLNINQYVFISRVLNI